MTKPLSIALALALTLSAAHAGNWPNWRGPNHDGSAAADETNLPAKFSPKENVKWVAQLPGKGASTPIVWDDAVFVTAADENQNGIVAVRVDRKSGDIVWSKKFADGIRKDDRSNYAAPSAVTDGEIVVFFSGNGILTALDFSGDVKWTRDIQKDYGEFAFGWTFSTSPVLHGGKLYLQVLQRDTAVDGRGFTDKKNESYLLALDPLTGKQIWQVNRKNNANVESREAFTTPVVITHDGKSELVVIGGDELTGHDLETGNELWRWGTWNPGFKEKFWRLVPSPVYGAGVILACGPKGAPIYAIKAGATGNVSNDQRAIAWVSEKKELTTDVPTPLFYDGLFYVLTDRKKTLNCVDPLTGNIVWSGKLDAKVKLESSPTGADGKIYLMSHLGEIFVVAAGGDEFKLLNATQLGEMQSTNIRASIVPAHGNLFIRTDDKLFCIGE